MQLTLLASLAVLCSTAFAAPPAPRDDGSLVDVIAYVEDVLDNATVNALTKRDDALVNAVADFKVSSAVKRERKVN
ncbi:hypothetical protein BDR03DRAFT_1014504 [Suillus americanus]|nr:hypothetical protein BDR03DRAFT_1014504 [Suillus americanus]